jgi:hypothetical protein
VARVPARREEELELRRGQEADLLESPTCREEAWLCPTYNEKPPWIL